MKYLNSTITGWLRMFACVVIIAFLNVYNVSAQCSLACNGSTQVSLDVNCQANITATMILNDQTTSCPTGVYEVTLSNQYGDIPTSPIADASYIGQELYAKVTDVSVGGSGNSCWGTIWLEDKLGPTIDECPTAPIDVRCNDLSVENGPSFIDACEGAAEAVLVSERIEPIECDDDYIKTITRVYTSYDSKGTKSPDCVIVYNLLRINFDDISCPPDYIRDDNNALSCDGNWKASQLCSFGSRLRVLDTDTNGDGILDVDMRWDDNNNGYPEPEEVGVPTILTTVDGEEIDLDLYPFPDVYCNSAMLYTDIELPQVGCSKKIMRTWTLREWHCSGERTFACDPPQILEIVDDTAPVIKCPEPQQITTNTIMGATTTSYGSVTCGSSIALPLPDASDDCSTYLTYDVTYEGGYEADYDGSSTIVLPMGANYVLYTVYDECYNSSECYLHVDIIDRTPPVAICDQYTAVSLTTGGAAVVRAETFDDGSYDDCKEHCMLVRRMTPNGCDCKVPEFCGLNYIGNNNDSYYYLSTYSIAANIAKSRAEAYGGSLAIFETEEEEEWLVSKVRQNYSERFWIGMKRFGNGFLWDDHEGLAYENWSEGRPLSSNTSIDLDVYPYVGNSVLVYDGAKVSDAADMVSDITLKAGPSSSIVDITWKWIPRSVGTYTVNDGVNLKLLHYDGYSWKTIYTERYTGLNTTNTIEDLLDETQYGSFRYNIPGNTACGKNVFRIAIEDNAFASDVIVGDFATDDCGSHFDNADVALEVFSGECVGDCVMMNPYNEWNDAECFIEIPYILEIKDICGFSTVAKFCCADVGTDQMVVFRVVDVFGNYNDCMVNIDIQDKVAPSLICPPDETVDCDFALNPANLSQQFGVPTLSDDCGADVEESGINELSNCNLGTYTRVFTATDNGGRTSTCKQIITFENPEPFIGNVDIDCPRDTIFIGCMAPEDLSPEVTGYPEFATERCGLIGTNYEDEVFTFSGANGDACFKILRTWEIIDWCQSSLPIWSCVQVIKVSNGVKPVITGCDSVEVCTYDSDCLMGYVELKVSATDDCTSDANLRWRYAVYAGELGVGPKSYSDPVAEGSGDGPMAEASGDYPVGSHVVRWTYFDRCGNAITCDQPFTIANCKAPTAYCIAGLAVDLMPMDFDGDGTPDFGMVELWASDFNAGSSHPCGSEVFLSFSPDTADRFKTFDCTTRGDQDVQIWASVVGYNGELIQTFCTSILNVQDNNFACQGQRDVTVTVGGEIFTEELEMVSKVDVILEGSPLVENTDIKGEYSFPDMPMGGDYIVNPYSNENPLNGVSTLDLVEIQRHILGIQELNSPYKIIAADVNKDFKLTSLDLLELRKLILGVYDELPNNDSWRFVDNDYQFINPEYPLDESYTEDYLIQKLDTDMNIDFIAIKVGDVNNTVDLGLNKSLDNSGNVMASINLDDQMFEAGDMIEIPIEFTNQNNSDGFQFSLNYDSEIIDLESLNGASFNKSNYRLIEDEVLISWHNTQGELAKGNVFTIKGTAKKSGMLSDVISIGNSLKPEVYSQGLVSKPVITFNVEADEVEESIEEFQVFQNSPNPFTNSTDVSFIMEESGKAEISITDVQGRIVKTINDQFNKGKNTVTINSNELGSAGIFYLTLKTNNNIATLKMVAIR